MRVVHCKREKFDVYIGRPSKWGNPFEIGQPHPVHGHGMDREEVITLYRHWILGRPDLLRSLPELQGKVLGCWCAPKGCHGDVLVDLAGRYNNE